MTTALTMINDAARLIGMTATGQTLSAEEVTDALSALNQMLHSWELDNIILGHSDLGQNDTIQLPSSYMETIKYNLAVKIAADIPIMPSNYVIYEAERLKDLIELHNVDIEPMTLDTGLLRNRANRQTYE
ncbi:MAG: hypothetical protein NXI13_16415 [Proteobacteria bacterium]|nr:hypothetical protein [Pseudomonadota bacterium]